MDTSPSPATPVARPRSSVRVALAVLGLSGVVCMVQAPFSPLAPSAGSAEAVRQAAATKPPDAADGVVPDDVTVSAFDQDVPAVARLDSGLLAALRQASVDAEGRGVALRVNSGWRSRRYQHLLFEEAVTERGSRAAAARWVAPAEKSAHVSGQAVDVGPPAAARWLAQHGAAYGLCQVYRNEPWHYELRPEAGDDGCPPMYADTAADPRTRQ